MWNDIAADRLPSFAWIAPDDCRDMHWMNGPCETPGRHDPRLGPPGGSTSAFYSHYSLTAAFEASFELPLLAGAKSSWVTLAPIH
jgi:hypothetical protein